MITTPATWCIDPNHPDWPAQLNQLGDDMPHELHGMGLPPGVLNDPSRLVTITGSRAATAYGESNASFIAQELIIHRSRTVITGGAYGVDAAVLRGALSAGASPIAVLPGGFGTLHPRGNAALLERVAEKGLLLTEHPHDAPVDRTKLLRRSMLLAALAGTTVIIEAAYRSNSRHTATAAHQLGRPVGALPGPVSSAASAGTNKMIADGIARLVTDATEVARLGHPAARP